MSVENTETIIAVLIISITVISLLLLCVQILLIAEFKKANPIPEYYKIGNRQFVKIPFGRLDGQFYHRREFTVNNMVKYYLTDSETVAKYKAEENITLDKLTPITANNLYAEIGIFAYIRHLCS